MLIADDLCCNRGRRSVLRGVSLRLPPGEVLGVLGANGAGKTTLLATLAGELAPSRGELSFDGVPLAGWKAVGLARQRAVLPQSSSLAFDLGVRDVVAMGAYPFPELSPDALAALACEALQMADAQAFAERRYASLSGGEQQRVQFARVLVQLLAARPPDQYRVLFLDEPTASLDPRHQLLLLGAVSDLARQRRIAALVVLHDVNLAAAHCDRLLLLAGGRQVALDRPVAALTEANLRTVYGLRAHVCGHPERPEQPLVLFGAR